MLKKLNQARLQEDPDCGWRTLYIIKSDHLFDHLFIPKKDLETWVSAIILIVYLLYELNLLTYS